MAGVAAACSTAAPPPRTIRSASETRLPPVCAAVEVGLDPLERRQHRRQLGRVVDLPVLLRREADAGAVGAAALVAVAEGRRGRPRGRDQLRRPTARMSRIAAFSAAMSASSTSSWSTGGHRVLPDQLLVGDLRAEVPRHRSHVAVGELVPGPGERVGELVGVLVEAPRDRLVDRVEPQRQVGGEHHRRVPLRRVVGVGHGVVGRPVGGPPLVGARGALRQLPLVAEQVLEEVVVPRRRASVVQAPSSPLVIASSPSPRAEGVPPAEALLLEAGALGLAADVLVAVGGAVGLAEGVPAGDERDRLLVVHGHAGERLADVPAGGDGVGVAVGPLGVHVDEAHLHRAERVGELAVAAGSARRRARCPPAPSRCPPRAPTRPRGRRRTRTSRSPSTPGRTLPARIIRSAHEILRPYFCLTGQSRRRALSRLALSGQLLSGAKRCVPDAGAAAAVVDAVGAGAVPRHPDEERPVVAVVGRPPVLRVGHHRRRGRPSRRRGRGWRTPRRSRSPRPSGRSAGSSCRAAGGSAARATSAGSPSSPVAVWELLSTGHVAEGASSSSVVVTAPVSWSLMMVLGSLGVMEGLGFVRWLGRGRRAAARRRDHHSVSTTPGSSVLLAMNLSRAARASHAYTTAVPAKRS